MLAGKVALVTGASQGIGRGIALQLGQEGATVYITGRTLDSKGPATLGSLKATAAEIESRGGKCIPVRCDHSIDADVVKVFDKIRAEQGHLDILVNNAYSAVPTLLENAGKEFWDQELDVWDSINNVGLRGHYICAVLASRMMVPQHKGLIVNVSSIGGKKTLFTPAYGVGKCGVDRMAADCAKELRQHGIAYVTLWPDAVKTEKFLAAMKANPDNKPLVTVFSKGESIEFSGKAVVHLAADKNIMAKTGQVVCTADLATEYGYKDIDGRVIPSQASVKAVLTAIGWKWTAAMVPVWLTLPQWLFMWLAVNVDALEPNLQ